MTRSGIYAITSCTSGKSYIGSTANLKRRLSTHRSWLARGRHPNAHLQSAWRKYDETDFLFEVLISCEPKDLIFYEQRAIDKFDSFNNGYNLRPIAESNRGRVVSPETREKLRLAHAGRKQSPELIAKRALGMVGTKRSDEAKARMSKAQTGKKMSDEARAKMSARVYSAEFAENMRIKKTGTKMSAEARAKMSASAKAWRAKKRLAEMLDTNDQAPLGAIFSPGTS